MDIRELKKKISHRNNRLVKITVNLIFQLRTFFGEYPLIFYPIDNRIGGRNPVVKNTEICVEGFQSSGNSFFVYMFTLCNDVKVGSHKHVIAQIKRSKKFGIPIVILIRRPMDAVLSYMSRNVNFSASTLLRGYIHFYQSVLDLVSGEVLAVRFETITGGAYAFNSTIRAINRRFGKSYRIVNNFGEAKKRFFRRVPPTSSTKPSQKREVIKKRVKPEIESNSLLCIADILYDRFLAANSSI